MSLTEVKTPYSKAFVFFGISASEVVSELKKLPITKVGNLNEWSVTKLTEEIMILLYKQIKRKPKSEGRKG